MRKRPPLIRRRPDSWSMTSDQQKPPASSSKRKTGQVYCWPTSARSITSTGSLDELKVRSSHIRRTFGRVESLRSALSNPALLHRSKNSRRLQVRRIARAKIAQDSAFSNLTDNPSKNLTPTDSETAFKLRTANLPDAAYTAWYDRGHKRCPLQGASETQPRNTIILLKTAYRLKFDPNYRGTLQNGAI